jgi:AroM protein
MAGRRLGVVTFGHSGGADLGDDLGVSFPGCEIYEQGLLDDVSEAGLRSWQASPASKDGTVVHLRDGRELTIESAPLLARVGPALALLATAQPQVVLYGCAGPLPEYSLPAGVVSVRPQQVLKAFVAETVRRGRVGIVVPSPLHVEPTKHSYSASGRLVDARAASPADREAVLAAATSLGTDGAGIVILGCFDHTLRDLRAAQSVTSRPVVSSRQLAFSAVRDLLTR